MRQGVPRGKKKTITLRARGVLKRIAQHGEVNTRTKSSGPEVRWWGLVQKGRREQGGVWGGSGGGGECYQLRGNGLCLAFDKSREDQKPRGANQAKKGRHHGKKGDEVF